MHIDRYRLNRQTKDSTIFNHEEIQFTLTDVLAPNKFIILVDAFNSVVERLNYNKTIIRKL